MVKIKNIEMINNNNALKVVVESKKPISQKKLDRIISIQHEHFKSLGCVIENPQITKLGEKTFQIISSVNKLEKKITDWKINELSRKIFLEFQEKKQEN